MVVIIDSDEELRQLVYVHPYVAVKYHSEAFEACRELYPVYKKISNQKKYGMITFVRVNADENLIAKKIIEKNVFSFMAIYKKGLLLESRTVSSGKDIEELLEQLLASAKS